MSQKRISDFFLKPAPPDPAKRPRQTPEPCVPATGQQQAAERPAGPHPPSPVLPGASQEAISFKPPQDYNFPARKFSGENFSRSCKAAWFREWQWLEYIAVSDGIVCGVCRSAVKSKLVGSDTDSLFLKDKGFSNWRKATEKIRDHEKTRIHLDAMQRLAALKTTPINALLSEAAAKEQRTARKMLELIFSSVRFLGRQGLSQIGMGCSGS